MNFTRTLEIIIDFLAVSVVLADIYGMATCRQGIDGVGIRLCKKKYIICVKITKKIYKICFSRPSKFWRKKIVVWFDEIFLTQTEPEIKKNEFWRKNIEIGYYPNTSLEKYTQLQHAKHVLCMLLQAGKWYNYYLFFWCSHFWHACHEFLRIFVYNQLCLWYFLQIFVRNPIISSFYFRQKKIFKTLLSENEKHKRKKNPWSFLARILK